MINNNGEGQGSRVTAESIARAPLAQDSSNGLVDVWNPGPPDATLLQQLRRLSRRGGWVNRWRE